MALWVLPVAQAQDPEVLGTVKLAWNLSWEPDIGGYRVHYGTESGLYTEVVDVGYQVKAQLEGLPVGSTYYCAVTAYNTYGLESPYSNEITFTVALPPLPIDSDNDGLSNLFEVSHSDSGDLDPHADLDGDHLSNLMEYAHGLDPLSPNSQRLMETEPLLVDGERYMSISYLMDPLAESFVSIHLERSTDLSDPGGWKRGDDVLVSSQPSPENPDLIEIVTRSQSPISTVPCEFLRLAYDIHTP